ncbi:hypothetical protein KKA96_01195, partial [Patescibacteria group bacterium]|nr:hypothetical protein [Patescibacteria group bacterium]
KWMCVGNTNKCFTDFYAQLMEGIDILFWKYPYYAISFDFKDAASIGISAIYTFIYGIVLMALGVFLVIRIAVLALLIILSPLAFVGEVFPGLKEISSKWWDNLIKYVMFGPIFALMLYVSGLMAQNTIAVDPAIFETNPNLSWMAQNITLILTNIIPLIFLIGIIPVTKALGIAGANAIFAGAATATFGGMAVMGRAWGKGQLFPGQNRIRKAGGRIGGMVLKKSPRISAWWYGKNSAYAKKIQPGMKNKIESFTNKVKTGTRGIGGGIAGKAYDWMGEQRAGIEKEMFGETKTLGKYAEMGMNVMNPEKLKLGYKKWIEDSYRENYKIPLGASPDERRKIEMMDAHKSVNDLKTAGGLDNPERVSDKAAKEFKNGNEMSFEILTKLLAAQDKQYKVLSSINRETGTNYSEDGEGWSQFLNDYKNKVGTDRASNFGQEVGNLARKEGNWSAGNIAYYENGENKIRDISKPAEYKIYVEKNAEDISKKELRQRWPNMSADNWVKKDATGNVTGLNEIGRTYIEKHLTAGEIEDRVKTASSETLKKIKQAIDVDIRTVSSLRQAYAQDLSDKIDKIING